jgi:hypothetical protein
MKITTLVVDSDNGFTVDIHPNRDAAVTAGRQAFDEDDLAEYDEQSSENDHFVIGSTVVNITEHDTQSLKDPEDDLVVSYRDVRESLALILGSGTTNILGSLDDAVSNNLGD